LILNQGGLCRLVDHPDLGTKFLRDDIDGQGLERHQAVRDPHSFMRFCRVGAIAVNIRAG
jgi:hypothetical protein